jgi:hypothetical protein
MGQNTKPCAALVALLKADLCRNGFATGPGCRHSPGGPYVSVPECCREERCGTRYAETGGRPLAISAERMTKLSSRYS